MLALFQSRNMYIIVMLLPVALAYFGYKKAFFGTVIGLAIMVLSLFVVEKYEIKIPGRISDVSLSAVSDRFLSISGKHGDVSGARGVTQRLDWWASSLKKWSASPQTVVFGVGYGIALTNFTVVGGEYNEGIIVREPHNSLISSLVRGGFVYLGLWGWIVFSSLHKAYKAARLPGLSEKYGSNFKGFSAWSFLVLLMIFFSCLSEPIFESPAMATMYYFLAGIITMEYYIVTKRVILEPSRQNLRFDGRI